ncbi:glycosyltransferase family 8 protein [Cronobacter turicensis]|uniref:glycosyltransferase family 8 protein n=1 Tax=Cronobacter turicensis TaxID=413502 RepID=UPI00141272D1|nr:glycosyltransferase family 8 protein [Cronobacter turicensis]NHV07961.1 glycosyltransferase family 8 protein [Cronobacter turicensis]NHV63152.1 glycosyltransferase family 8 protein [Cronobacter turicensis]NHW10093.1 glycosyltransferase family 8 protein [Cronobacter turicensis]
MYSLVMGFRDNYKKYGYTTLYSLLKNNREHSAIVYILSDDLAFDYFFELEKEFACKIIPIKISASYIDKVNCGHLTFGTLIRLLIGTYLPKELDKVLYIDADLIIDASIDELWQENIDGYYAAVVPSSSPKSHLKKIGVAENKYFNAGVMLINLTLCRQNDVFARALELVTHNNYKFLDQDALNIVMSEKVKFVPAKWNFDSFRAKTLLLKNEHNNKEKIEIYHFTGRDKPWIELCSNQYQSVYLKYYCDDLGFSVERNHSHYSKIKFLLINFLYRNVFTRKFIFHVRNIIRTNIQ